ncbi:MAG: DJ-1/PfpI family protein [Spirochaetaceae bacterium]|nr:DJ-1/PfpI family protein [Spirochaetaceae bacterium]
MRSTTAGAKPGRYVTYDEKQDGLFNSLVWMADAVREPGRGSWQSIAAPDHITSPVVRPACSEPGRFRRGDDSRRAFCPWNCLDEGSPVELCRRAAEAGKVAAGICHGPRLLAAADLEDGRRIAGFTACRDDVITMGARDNFG